jgi:hypothetical protein
VPFGDLGLELVEHINKRDERGILDFCGCTAVGRIPDKGNGGLFHIFFKSAISLNLVVLEWIRKHPSFSSIPAQSNKWGLSCTLMGLVDVLFPLDNPEECWVEFMEVVLNHPNSRSIQLESEWIPDVQKFLFKMVLSDWMRLTSGADRVFASLLSKITQLQIPNRKFGLGRLLVYAAWHGALDFVKAILQCSALSQILSNPVVFDFGYDGINSKKFEDEWEIDSFGLSEALFATLCCELEVEFASDQKMSIFCYLFSYARTHNIGFKVNESFGLADCLTKAAEALPDAVPIILSHVLSEHIAPDASDNEGSLRAALHNAAEDNHLEAVKALLEHPKACEIDRDKLAGIRDRALTRDYREIVAVLTNFLREAGYTEKT